MKKSCFLIMTNLSFDTCYQTMRQAFDILQITILFGDVEHNAPQRLNKRFETT